LKLGGKEKNLVLKPRAGLLAGPELGDIMNIIVNLYKRLKSVFKSKETTAQDSPPPLVTPPNQKNVYTTSLEIRFVDGSWVEYSNETESSSRNLIYWRKFLKWYYSRSSEDYLFLHRTGAFNFKRSNIKSFEIKTKPIKPVVEDPGYPP